MQNQKKKKVTIAQFQASGTDLDDGLSDYEREGIDHKSISLEFEERKLDAFEGLNSIQEEDSENIQTVDSIVKDLSADEAEIQSDVKS